MKTTNEKLKQTLKEIQNRNKKLETPYAERLFNQEEENKTSSDIPIILNKEDKELFQ